MGDGDKPSVLPSGVAAPPHMRIGGVTLFVCLVQPCVLCFVYTSIVQLHDLYPIGVTKHWVSCSFSITVTLHFFPSI